MKYSIKFIVSYLAQLFTKTISIYITSMISHLAQSSSFWMALPLDMFPLQNLNQIWIQFAMPDIRLDIIDWTSVTFPVEHLLPDSIWLGHMLPFNLF